MSDILSGCFGPPKLKFKCAFHNTIYDVLLNRGFKEVTGETDMSWDIFWCEKDWIREVFDKVHLSQGQKVNHFRNHFMLTRKDNLAKHVRKARREAEKEGRLAEAKKFDMIPQTFLLPSEYSLFVDYFKKETVARPIYIAKPIGRSQGKGIFLFDRLASISDWRQSASLVPGPTANNSGPGTGPADVPDGETDLTSEPYVVQRYIHNPLLIGGKKFDMRLYALVTAYSPLNVWIYRTGFARFAHTRYSLTKETLENTTMHLTNVAVQKKADNYDSEIGGKWDLNRMRIFLKSVYGDTAIEELFVNLEQIMIYAIKAVQKAVIQDPHCFELYGFDVMVDDTLRPWLLEVNASPSLSANTTEDYWVKYGLLDDVITVLDIEGRGLVNKDTLRVGGFDAVVRNNELVPRMHSTLGTVNDRRDQLRQLCETRRPAARSKTRLPDEDVE